ncbi:MAG: hypothetical protein P8076_02860 [Gammaproteobacteria bacterium]
MTATTKSAKYFDSGPRPAAGGFDPIRSVGRVLRTALSFLDSMHAAQAVAWRAESYYAMSDEQLARIGLTRDQVPAELLRELDRARLH